MTTIPVKDANGATVNVELPLTPGSTSDAASRPIAFSTEGKAQLGSITETAPATDTASSGLNGRLQRIAQRITSMIALLPAALGAGGGMKVQVYNVAGTAVDPVAAGPAADAASVPVSLSTESKALLGSLTETAPATDTASSGISGRLQRIAQRITTMMSTGQAPRSFVVAFATLTRPANTTPYTALDSISDNATAGSVTALVSGNISDVNDDPLTITELLLTSTDTGLAGKVVRAYLYNSDPTASTGVVGGDNAAFSNKKAGYIGSLSGVMETGFSDGANGRLVPTWADTSRTPSGGFIVAKPASGAKTLWVQYQSVDGFTPSANSTTLIGTLKGFQGRAA